MFNSNYIMAIYCSLVFEGSILNMRDTFGASYGTHGAFGYLGTQLLPPRV